MERLVVLNRSNTLDLSQLPHEITASQTTKTMTIPIGVPLKEVERKLMAETLKTTKGDKRLAAKLLGVHPGLFTAFWKRNKLPLRPTRVNRIS